MFEYHLVVICTSFSLHVYLPCHCTPVVSAISGQFLFAVVADQSSKCTVITCGTWWTRESENIEEHTRCGGNVGRVTRVGNDRCGC